MTRPTPARFTAPRTRALSVLAAAAALTLFAAPQRSAAEVEGETAQNRPYVTGGVSIEEAAALERQRKDYRLWVVTADRGSGAWLAGAQAVLRDSRGEVVLETTLDGPYLLVDLEPGRYALEVRHEGQTQRQQVSVGRSGTRQLVMYFDTPANVSPDMPDRQIARPDGGGTDDASPGATQRR